MRHARARAHGSGMSGWPGLSACGVEVDSSSITAGLRDLVHEVPVGAQRDTGRVAFVLAGAACERVAEPETMVAYPDHQRVARSGHARSRREHGQNLVSRLPKPTQWPTRARVAWTPCPPTAPV